MTDSRRGRVAFPRDPLSARRINAYKGLRGFDKHLDRPTICFTQSSDDELLVSSPALEDPRLWNHWASVVTGGQRMTVE